MLRYGIRTGLLGLALLLSASLSTAAWAGDAELFADVIPGTALTDEELDEVRGRGVAALSLNRLLASRETTLADFIRERVKQILDRSSGMVAAASSRALQTRERAMDNALATAEQALAKAVATRQRSLGALGAGR